MNRGGSPPAVLERSTGPGTSGPPPPRTSPRTGPALWTISPLGGIQSHFSGWPSPVRLKAGESPGRKGVNAGESPGLHSLSGSRGREKRGSGACRRCLYFVDGRSRSSGGGPFEIWVWRSPVTC